MSRVAFGVLLCAVAAAQPKGWNPHEGGLLQYRVEIRFGTEPETMPPGWRFGRVSAVGVDAAGHVYVFHRGAHADPVVVLDAQGAFLRGWGRGQFVNPHGLRIARDGSVWVTDTGNHTVRKFTPDGKLLLTLGTPGKTGATENTFNRPTDIAFSPRGDFIYVTDGYGNSRVVKFTAAGQFVKAWGRKGTGPGEFNTPHVIVADASGTLYVSDRENNRIQIFDADGKFLHQWTHLGATQGLALTPDGELWAITHRSNIENLTYDTLSGRIMKLDRATGKILGSIESPGHWIDVTPEKLIFVGSLTGNVFRFRPGWLKNGLGAREGQQPAR